MATASKIAIKLAMPSVITREDDPKIALNTNFLPTSNPQLAASRKEEALNSRLDPKQNPPEKPSICQSTASPPKPQTKPPKSLNQPPPSTLSPKQRPQNPQSIASKNDEVMSTCRLGICFLATWRFSPPLVIGVE